MNEFLEWSFANTSYSICKAVGDKLNNSNVDEKDISTKKEQRKNIIKNYIYLPTPIEIL